ncbi:MAG: ABC transporter ATP-binding protein [Candidatus Cyclobacteriaceae bacterium M3_2C_046]
MKAVQGLSLEIHQGNIFGLLGPNGSGKTTTLGIILGVTNKSSGSFYWFGKPGSKNIRKRIGAILESPAFYPYLSAVENLKIIARIKQVGYERIDQVLQEVYLFDRKNDPFRTYSLGMKQRLAIGAALLPDPDIMILDEPTNGLDPQGIKEIRDLIIKIGENGKTIVLASHLLAEVQKVCTHFAVLNKGRKMYQGSVAQALGGKEVVEVSAPSQYPLKSVLQENGIVTNLEQEKDLLLVTLREDKTAFDLNHYLSQKGIVVSHLAKRTKSLEAQFLEILSQSEHA